MIIYLTDTFKEIFNIRFKFPPLPLLLGLPVLSKLVTLSPPDEGVQHADVEPDQLPLLHLAHTAEHRVIAAGQVVSYHRRVQHLRR